MIEEIINKYIKFWPLYFKNQELQRSYYQKKIDNDIRLGGVGCKFVKIKAPNLSGIDITNQVYEIPMSYGEPIYDAYKCTCGSTMFYIKDETVGMDCPYCQTNIRFEV